MALNVIERGKSWNLQEKTREILKGTKTFT